ncbi:kinase-like domain-containing protein [Xylariaceae sp. FL0594]|nr:kinase-like domain-containing protein [Xylariaceae sp. FL0594]
MRPLDAAEDAGASGRIVDAKIAYQRTTDYFSDFAGWTLQRPLGFGGFGLALKYRYAPPGGGGAGSRNYVVKVGLDGWNDRNIRIEADATRKVARAAHCVQIVAPEKAGLPAAEKFEFSLLRVDDSSDSHTSSGEESRDDAPPPPPPRRRGRGRRIPERSRVHLEANIPALNAKGATFTDRYNDAARRHNQRVLRLRNAMNASRAETRKWQLDYKDYLILECCESGELMGLIARVHQNGGRFPNRVLWSFWLCLVRACVAMSYPPRKFHPLRRSPVGPPPPPGSKVGSGVELLGNYKRIGNDLYEDLPYRNRRWAEKKMVHFDIDPSNIFIDTIDQYTLDEEHRLVPKLKLGDFGMAHEVKPRKRNVYYDNRRFYGKAGHYAPEQFGPEWDHIRESASDVPLPPDQHGSEVSGEKIAGNYGPPMNVWAVALIMWQLITGLHPPMPPNRGRATDRDGNRLPTHYAVLILDPDPHPPAHTGGRRRRQGQHEGYAHVDYELRHTIARCLAHDPAKRPPAGRLLEEAKRGIRKRFPGETEAMVRRWVNEYIDNA